ncbi:MAG: translation initiation factor IF-3 [Nanoarchaeota archaeon]
MIQDNRDFVKPNNSYNNSNNNNKDSQKRERYYRTNEYIRGVNEVRIFDQDNKPIGIMRFDLALKQARELGLDLVEINRNSNPPVCRIIDFGKFKYEEEKKKKVNKRNQTKVEVKEIVFRPNTNVHDLEVKAKKTKVMIDEGNKVKVSIQIKGREMLHPEVVEETMNTFLAFVGCYTKDGPMKMEGKVASIFIMK